MPLTVTHATAADSTFSASGTTNWNAGHTVTGTLALDSITAATGAVTIASGNNTGIVWNWANTTDATSAFTFGETNAATGGTSTAGVPNQILLKLTTLAASTQSPLSVYARGTHVFSVPPAGGQVLGANGTAALPFYSFAAATTTGIYQSGAVLSFAISGAQNLSLNSTTLKVPNGSSIVPGLTNLANQTTGLVWPAANVMAINDSTDGEWARFLSRAFQASRGSADAVSYAINFRKARGTVAVPTVITTGDDLLTVSGYGYLGATNTYQEGARILFDSTGTISDATTGIGGILSFQTRKQGTDTAVIERFRVDDAGHLVSIAGTANTPTVTSGGGTNPSILGTDNAFVVTIGTGGLASSVEVTFGTAYANAPIAMAESDTDIVALKSVALTNKVTISAAAAFTAGSNIDCLCFGRA